MDRKPEALLEESKKTKALHPDEIPELDLYIDQIISLMSAHLDGTDDKEPLTRTMIHNYSKAGLISPVKGKKYSKKHILQMLVIYSLKNTLSITEVKRILSGAEKAGMGAKELAACFDTQLERREKINRELSAALGNIMKNSEIDTTSTEDVLSFLLSLTDVTDTLTRFASAVTQEYFPEIPLKKKK